MNIHSCIEADPGVEAPNVETLTGSSAPSGMVPVFEPIASTKPRGADEAILTIATETAALARVEEAAQRANSDDAGELSDQLKTKLSLLSLIAAQSPIGVAAKAQAALIALYNFRDCTEVEVEDLIDSVRVDAGRLDRPVDLAALTQVAQSKLLALGAEFEAAWQDELAVYKATDGDDTDEAVTLQSEATDRTGHIVCLIKDVPATNFEELRVKVRAFRWTRTGADPGSDMDLSGSTDHELMKSITEDVEGMLPVLAGYRVLPSPDLDKPIAEAWAEYQRLRPLEKEAYERESELINRMEREGPKRPQAMIPRNEDFPEDSIRFASESAEGVSYYTPRAVAIFRDKPRNRKALVDQTWTRAPSPEDQARADEIVAAYDQWTAEKDKFRDEIGVTKVREEADALGEQVYQLSKLVRETPALSLLGIQIKAAWAKTLLDNDEDDEDLAAVVEQVEAFAQRHAYVHSHKDIRAGEESIDLPAADWKLYHLFCRWLESNAATDAAIDAQDVADTKSEGFKAIQDAAFASIRETTALRRQIIEMPATSFGGIRLKAHVFADCGRFDNHIEETLARFLSEGKTSDQTIAYAIARDLARMDCATSLKSMADRPKRQSRGVPDPRALEAYRTWLSNEFRSLTAEMYPDDPEMTGAIAVNNTGDKFHFRGEPPASCRAERMLTILGLDWAQDKPSVFVDQQAAA